MRRIASTLLTGVLLLTLVAGCSLFKKKDTTADTYAGPQDSGMTDPYGAYSAAPMDTTSTAGVAGGRYHTVQKKETLYSISRQYYGDHTKWKDIYAANRSDISDPNKIRVGQRLMIP